MTSFIRCPSCNFCIGKYTEFFDLAKQAMYYEALYSDQSAYKDFDPDKLSLIPNVAPPLEPIFDALDIKNRCCRMRLLGKTDFDKMYK